MIISNNTPLSEQIREAQHEYALAQREYDLLEGMRTVLRERRVCALVAEGLTQAKAKSEIEGSEWYEGYIRNVVEAKYAALDARGKWEFLLELAKEQRDAGFQDRLMAKI